MRIYLDGCDGTGKSTLADELSKEFNLDKFCLTKDSEKSVSRYLEIRQIDNTIFDRTFLSEIVYPKVFGRKEWMTDYDKEILLYHYLKLDPDDVFIILTAENEDIKKRILSRGDEYPEILDNISKINKKYVELAFKYHIQIIDTSVMDLKEIIQIIRRRK